MKLMRGPRQGSPLATSEMGEKLKMTTAKSGARDARGERKPKNGPDGLTGPAPSEREAASVGGSDRSAGENSTGGRSLGTNTQSRESIEADGAEPGKESGSVRHRDLMQSARALAPVGFTGVGYCGRATHKSKVWVMHDPQTFRNSAWVSNKTVCKLTWVCPECESRLAWENQEMLKDSIAGWTGLGASHAMALMTLTVRHDVRRPLAETLSVLLKAFNLLIDCGTMRRLKREGAFVGWFRALEITYSTETGWHPHLHILFFTEDLAALNRAFRTPSKKDRERMTPKQAAVLGIKEEWSRLVNKASNDLGVSRKIGAMQKLQHLTEVDTETATQIAGYLTKDGRKWDVAAEMTRSDVKEGRVKSLAPRQLLLAAGSGDLRSKALWHEYVRAMKGVTRLQPSYYDHKARTTMAEYLHTVKEATEHHEQEVVAGRVKKDPRAKANRRYNKLRKEAFEALSFEERMGIERRKRELAAAEEAMEPQFGPVADFMSVDDSRLEDGILTLNEFNRSGHLEALIETVRETPGTFGDATRAVERYSKENGLPVVTTVRASSHPTRFLEEYAERLRNVDKLDEGQIDIALIKARGPAPRRTRRSFKTV